MDGLATTYVTIRPDASGFRRDTEAQIKRDLAGSGIKVKVNADTAAAARDVAELHTELAALGKKGANVKVDVNDTAARAKLLAMQARLHDLGRLSADPNIDVGGVLKARAGLAALGVELNKLDHAKAEPKVKLDTNRAQDSASKLGLLLAGLAPAVVPLGGAGVAAVGAFGEALTVAGGGGAAFALAVIPAVKDTLDALKNLKKDGPAALDSLTQPQLHAAVALDQLKREYKSFQTGLQPVTLPIVTTGLDLANRELPVLIPIVKSAAGGIQDLENAVAHGLQSKEFHQFADLVAKEAGPSIEAFGNFVLGAAKGVGNLIVKLGPAIPTIDRFISGLGGGIDKLTASDTFGVFVHHIEDDVQLVGGFLHDLVVTVAGAAADLEPAGRNILTLADNVLPAFATGIHEVAQVITPVTGFLSHHTDIVLALVGAYATFKVGTMVTGIAASGAAAAVANPELAALAIVVGSVAAAYLAAKDGLTVTVEGMNEGLKGLKTGSDAANIAVRQLAPNFGKTADEFDQFATQAGVSRDQLEKLGKEYQEAQIATKAGLFNAPVIKQYQKDFRDVSASIRQYQKDARNASNPTYQYQQALKELTSSAAAGQDKIKLLDQALQGYQDTVAGLLGSNAALGDQLATTFKSLKGVDLNRIFSGQVVTANRATRAFASNLANLGQQMDQNLVEFAKQGHSTKEVAARYQELRGAFIKAAEGAGLTRDQARKLVDEYLKIPKDISTKVHADTKDAKKKLDDVASAKDKAKGDVKIKTEAEKYRETRKALDDIMHSRENATGTAKVDTQALHYRETRQALRDIRQDRDNAVGTVVIPTSAPGAKGTAGELGTVGAKARDIPSSRSVSVYAHDYASAVLDRLRGANGSVIATQYVDVHTRTVSGASAAPIPSLRAAGGTVDGPGTETSDSVPLWASRGEEIINARQAKKHRRLLKAINAGTMGFAAGGTVGYAGGGTVVFGQLQRDLLRLLAASISGTTSLSGLKAAQSNLVTRTTTGGLGDVVAHQDQIIKAGNRELASLAKQRATLIDKVRKADEVLADKKNATPTQERNARDTLRTSNAQLEQIAKKRADLIDQIAGAKSRRNLASGQESALVGYIRAENGQLKQLARERDRITARIQAALQNSAQVRSSAAQFASITNVGFSTAGQLNTGLRAKLATINRFTADITTLSKMGLNRNILGQLIAEGPENGGIQAHQLLGATRAQIRALNVTQKRLGQAGGRLGTIANNAVLGGDAAKAFVTGLSHQRAALEHEMDRLAARFSRGIKITLSGGVAHRAAGGPIAPGQWYMVGETQPELLRGGSQGRIYTPQQAGGLIDYDALARAIARAMPRRTAPLIGTVNQADNTDVQLAIRRVAFAAQEVGLA